MSHLRTFQNAIRPFGILHGGIRRSLSSVSSHRASDLQYNGVSYPYRWLRDSCQCPECVHPSNRQKLHRTTDIPADISPAPDGVKEQGDGVHIKWSSGHQSFYPAEFLHTYASPTNLRRFHRELDPIPWDSKRVQSADKLFVSYADVKGKAGLLDAIEQLTQYGLLFVTGVPTSKTSNTECETRVLAEHFGEIRNTFYGELWDVKNIRNSRNIAYTNLNLGYHIDLEYFDHPPRYQFLHCLRNRVQGGTSLFVDALNAALQLRSEHPADFDILTKTPVPFHYINDGHHLQNAHPTIELAPVSNDPSKPPEIRHINYSPPFQAPLPLSTPPEFYPALERFASLLEREQARFEYTLKEGDAVVFDNRRVLHARTAFVDDGDENQPEVNRWLKGCYIEAEGVKDRLRVLRAELGR